uniref:BRO-N domain-containing protein n=1 Tax=Stappia sp. TaxID=1870903 RepID=UPI003BA894AC
MSEKADTHFVASDVAAELGYGVAKDMARHLDDDEKGRHLVRTPGGDQDVSIVSEAGLYRAILLRRSNKKMQAWLSPFQRRLAGR